MITSEMKKEIICYFMEEHRKIPDSPEVQIALLTARISDLTEHLKGAQKRPSFQTVVC